MKRGGKKGMRPKEKERAVRIRVIHSPQKHESCWVAFCMGGDIMFNKRPTWEGDMNERLLFAVITDPFYSQQEG